MRKKDIWIFGLLSFALLTFVWGQDSATPRAGKYHPQNDGRLRTSTVTILNPALFHRLNTVLEPVLVNGK